MLLLQFSVIVCGKNELAQAEKAIQTAVKLKPKEQRYKELQRQIENNKES